MMILTILDKIDYEECEMIEENEKDHTSEEIELEGMSYMNV